MHGLKGIKYVCLRLFLTSATFWQQLTVITSGEVLISYTDNNNNNNNNNNNHRRHFAKAKAMTTFIPFVVVCRWRRVMPAGQPNVSTADIYPLRCYVQEGRACLLDRQAWDWARTTFTPFVVACRRADHEQRRYFTPSFLCSGGQSLPLGHTSISKDEI